MSERDLNVLALERQWGQAPEALRAKHAVAEREYGLSGGAYALVVNSLIDDPAAFAYDPETIRRLQEVREARRAAQAAQAAEEAAEA